MRICVIGGANVDITATSGSAFRVGDSNPGTVRVSMAGTWAFISLSTVLCIIVLILANTWAKKK